MPYTMQQRPGGGFNFANPYGSPISAYSYAKGTGGDFYNLLTSMSSKGDVGAGKFLQQYANTPYGQAEDRAQINSGSWGNYYPNPLVSKGLYDAITWASPQVQGVSTPNPYPGMTLQDFFNRKSNIYGTARDVAGTAYNKRRSSILDFLQGLQTSQRDINESGIQNELARKQGYNSILDMVGQGVRSGQTMLSNRNAMDSSATQALAQAYGKLGQRQLGQVGNRYELGQRAIGLQQQDLETARSTQLRRYEEDKINQVDEIVGVARDRLAQLDADMANASMPERIAIDREKNAIRAEVMDILNNYDAQLASGAAAVRPSSAEDRRREAFGLAYAGTAAQNPFEFSTEAPLQLQNTGPFASGLPLFTPPRRKRTA